MNDGLFGLPIGRELIPALFGFPLGVTGANTTVPTCLASQATVATPVGTNTKGSWTTVVSSCAFDADGFYITIRNGAVADFLVDIGIGSTGDAVDQTLVSNMLCSSGTNGAAVWSVDAYIPLPVPGGSRIACRAQSTDASQSTVMTIRPVRGSYYRAIRCKRAVTYGSDTSDSGGTQVDPGGSAGTKGTYSQITAATENPIRQALLCFGSRNNGVFGTSHIQLVDFAVGSSGAEVIAHGDMEMVGEGTADMYMPVWRNVFVNIPAGSRLAARSSNTQTEATDRLWDIAVIGFD